MNSLLTISLSLLAGIATAGSVWYVWGLVENITVFRKQKALEAEARRIEEEAAETDADDENDDA